MPVSENPSFYRFPLGAFEITSLLDGSAKRDGPYPIFGADQKEEDVHALLKQNFLPPTRYESPYTPTLVNTGKDLILFDTGNGPGGRDTGSGLLRDVLAKAGHGPDQIDIVVITHGHPDHIAGLMEGDEPAFPNARIVFGALEFDYWNKGENIPEARRQTRELFMKVAAPFGEKATFIDPGDDVVTGIRAIEAYGHSPGHLVFHVESENHQLLIWSDTCNHYVASLQRPDWHVSFDNDHEQAAATRKKIFDMVHTDRIPVHGYHMPFPALGYLDKRGSTYHWVPTSYQFNL
ncbi:MAG: MBL fold metallo-hydrolase [Hyphomicrobiaceae bacterium]|nr:MBL fold metallo-hydrolase [Hyphomicrobiaceae bacterium]